MFQTDGRTVERTDGRADGRTDGRTDGRSDRTCLNSRRMSRERQTQNQRERHGHGEWQALDQRQRKIPRHTHRQACQTCRQAGNQASARVVERSSDQPERSISLLETKSVRTHVRSLGGLQSMLLMFVVVVVVII